MLTNVSIISTNKVQDLLMKQITSQGHVVGSTFSEYGTAIREYKTNLPQVVIVDSDIIGSEITFKRFLYEIFYLESCPELVILSEYMELSSKQELVSVGINYFIEKPFQPARIWECLDDIELNVKSTGRKLINYSVVESILNDQASDEAILSKRELLSKQINSVRSQINNKKNLYHKDDLNKSDFEITFDTPNIKESINKNQDDNNPYLQSNINTNSYISLEGKHNSIEFNTNYVTQENDTKNGYLGLPKYIDKESLIVDHIDEDTPSSENTYKIKEEDNFAKTPSIKSKLKNFLSKR